MGVAATTRKSASPVEQASLMASGFGPALDPGGGAGRFAGASDGAGAALAWDELLAPACEFVFVPDTGVAPARLFASSASRRSTLTLHWDRKLWKELSWG
jgi:hypothetical protein